MLDTKRHWFKSLENFIGNLFGVLPLTPNHYTYLSGIFALIGLFLMMQHNLIMAILVYFIAAGFDLVDGVVARHKDMSSKTGAYLDTVFDRYVEGIIFLGMLFLPMPTILIPGYVWVFLCLFGSIGTTYVKAAAKEKDLTTEDIKGGWLSRAERLIFIFLALFLAVVFPDLLYTTYIIILIAILANITAIQRIFSAINRNPN